METNNTAIRITTINYAPERNFSQFMHHYPYDVCGGAFESDHECTDNDWAQNYYSFPTIELDRFINNVAREAVTFMLHCSGDDDTFDYIPALLEEAEQIYRLILKAFPDHEPKIIKACSVINETIKVINQLDNLDSIDATWTCITWADREEPITFQGKGTISLEFIDGNNDDEETLLASL